MQRLRSGHVALAVAVVAVILAVVRSQPGPPGAPGVRGAQGPRGTTGLAGARGESGAAAVGADDISNDLGKLDETVRYLCGALGPTGRAVAEEDFERRRAEAIEARAAGEAEAASALEAWERSDRSEPPPFVYVPHLPTRGFCEP